ncbi:hypothetical protein [Mesorhizobium sp.]|uniref:hypothetical protein n=1 Tax=Mesorhizobium sp. TaxID=1871066 RepID=UPI000FE8D194|nr:hypothetical protein [Mesorhizobium sp.]RWP64938.1 MAG: hypothetical protein EOR08_08470 [Mesorhizobium sp.]
MKIGDWPDEIKTVFRRRVVNAPEKIQRQAFGDSPIHSGYWRDNDLHIVAFGGRAFLKQIQLFEVRYGAPLPGISSKEAEGPVAMTSGRRITIAKITFEAPQIFALLEASSLLLVDFGIRGIQENRQLNYAVQAAFVVRLSPEFDWGQAADDFDFVLARWIAPFVERRQ